MLILSGLGAAWPTKRKRTTTGWPTSSGKMPVPITTKTPVVVETDFVLSVLKNSTLYKNNKLDYYISSGSNPWVVITVKDTYKEFIESSLGLTLNGPYNRESANKLLQKYTKSGSIRVFFVEPDYYTKKEYRRFNDGELTYQA